MERAEEEAGLCATGEAVNEEGENADTEVAAIRERAAVNFMVDVMIDGEKDFQRKIIRCRNSECKAGQS